MLGFKKLREGSSFFEIQSFLLCDRVEGLTTTSKTSQEATATVQTRDDKGPHQGLLLHLNQLSTQLSHFLETFCVPYSPGFSPAL